jgi:hypothetical protein
LFFGSLENIKKYGLIIKSKNVFLEIVNSLKSSVTVLNSKERPLRATGLALQMAN